MASKPIDTKSLFAFFKLCGNLKVSTRLSIDLYLATSTYFILATAPKTHRLGEERSTGARNGGFSHVSNGNDGISVR